MGAGIEGLGAGNFVLSCVTAFYNYLSKTREKDFFEYPDYYTFQTTIRPADYRMLDIYPDHKNITVEAEAERLLRAINDRGISILLVPDVSPTSPNIDDITLQSAQRRIEHCYVYSPDGCLDEAEFSISQPRHPTEGWYEATVESVGTESETSIPSFGPNDDWVVQQFRTVSLQEALARLPVN
ncbi:hypothetical protein [Halomarina litorea]|uniref:hypothetical protein n=1 Tax=Halomarina litorea TaxID=2961595 RepID=UPI0020C35991|nr:hypothetical protein [Halomarina sp. BCD28]